MSFMNRIFLFLILFITAVNVSSQQRNYDVEYSYVEAIRNREAGNLNAAAFILSSILRVDSACSACLFELSQIYRYAGSNDVALGYAARAYRIDSLNYWYIKNYADLLLEAGDSVAAVRLWWNMINMPSSTVDDKITFLKFAINFPGYREKGLHLCANLVASYTDPELYHLYFVYRKNITRESFASLNRFLDTCFLTFGPQITFLLDRSVLFAEFGKLRVARNYFMQILNADTFSYEAIYQYALFFSRRRDDRKLIFDYFDRFFSSPIDNSSKYEWLRLMLRTNSGVISAYLSDRLISVIRRDSLPASIFDEAFNFFLQRNRMELLEILGRRYVSLYPDNLSAWGRYILPLYAMGKYNELDSILAVRPAAFSSPFGMYVAGVLKYYQKDYATARSYLIQALNVRGNYGYKTNAVNMLADYYYNRGMRDSAFYYYEKAIQDDIADETIMNNYAYYLALSGKNLSKAEILARAAVMRYPKNSAFLDTYAWVLYRIKSYDEALYYMRKALRYVEGGDRRVLLEHYAAILYCAGKREKAIKLMRKLFPDRQQYGSFFMSAIECSEK